MTYENRVKMINLISKCKFNILLMLFKIFYTIKIYLSILVLIVVNPVLLVCLYIYRFVKSFFIAFIIAVWRFIKVIESINYRD